MTVQQTIVYIIDDEASIRSALERLCRSAGFEGRTFDSVETFLAAELRDENSCVLTDIRMPGTSGLKVRELLASRGCKIPVIFVTAYDTPESREEARRAGAAAYFRKPVDDQALLDAIEFAIGRPESSTR